MAGRPMIYSDIGGMVEKVDPDLDIPFSAGSPGAFADVIRLLVDGEATADAERLAEQARSRTALDQENYRKHPVCALL